MKKTVKTLVAFGISAILSMGTLSTAFAAETDYPYHMNLFGQELQQSKNNSLKLLGIVVGNCTITKDDFTVVGNEDGKASFVQIDEYALPSYTPYEANLDKLKAFFRGYDPEYDNREEDETRRYLNSMAIEANARYGFHWTGETIYRDTPVDSKLYRDWSKRTEHNTYYEIYIVKLPDGTDLSSIGEFQKHLIYADGSQNGNNTSNVQNHTSENTDADHGNWNSNETGWWIQFKDGSYLTNAWWQSPHSGLWYYMGADGYMVTNTVVDGYTINADGVWVQ